MSEDQLVLIHHVNTVERLPSQHKALSFPALVLPTPQKKKKKKERTKTMIISVNAEKVSDKTQRPSSLKNKTGTGGVAQAAEHLLCKH
jgi:hypothetical protein